MPYSGETKWELAIQSALTVVIVLASVGLHEPRGYYAVKPLLDHEIQVELTASDRVGLHRYCFAAGEEAKIMLIFVIVFYDYKSKNLWSSLRVRSSTLVTGMRETRAGQRDDNCISPCNFLSHSYNARFKIAKMRSSIADLQVYPGNGKDKVKIEGKALVASFLISVRR